MKLISFKKLAPSHREVYVGFNPNKDAYPNEFILKLKTRRMLSLVDNYSWDINASRLFDLVISK